LWILQTFVLGLLWVLPLLLGLLFLVLLGLLGLLSQGQALAQSHVVPKAPSEQALELLQPPKASAWP
jgi:hypothetical protein